MSARRVVINPLFLHRRSRFLWLWYVLTSAAASAVLWWRLDALGLAAGGLPASAFLRPWFRAAIVIAAGLAATAVTAASIAGPVGRIEDWLVSRRAGAKARPLRVRAGDAFETLIRLLNELHARSQNDTAATAPRKRRASAKPSTAPRRRAPRARIETDAPLPPRSASSQPNL